MYAGDDVAGGGSVSVRLNDDEKKFENCVELGVNQTTLTLASRMCRAMHKFFICQTNGTLIILPCHSVTSAGASGEDGAGRPPL